VHSHDSVPIAASVNSSPFGTEVTVAVGRHDLAKLNISGWLGFHHLRRFRPIGNFFFFLSAKSLNFKNALFNSVSNSF